MSRIPEMNLAPLTRFTPALMRRERNDLDAFVLALALAYNDSKTANWLLTVFVHEQPAEAITPYNGQVSGIRIHATRLLIGILQELLKAIRTAHDSGLLRQEEFVFCVEHIGDQGKQGWESLVDAATASEQKDPFRKWLVRVRNSLVSHYYQPRDLHSGYRAFFYERPTGPHNARAFASLGATLEESRFYFADAAVGAAYDDVLDPDDKAMTTVKAYIHHVNVALRGIVCRYCEMRHIFETGEAAPTDPP